LLQKKAQTTTAIQISNVIEIVLLAPILSTIKPKMIEPINEVIFASTK